MLKSIPTTMKEYPQVKVIESKYPQGSEILQKRVNESVLSHRGEEVTKCLMCDGNLYSDAIHTVWMLIVDKK